MSKLNKKKLAAVLCGIAVIALVAGTLAYYSSSSSIQNKLQTQQYGSETTEKFTPDTNWQPGEAVNKEVGVTNTGDYPLFVRIKMDETWTLSGGTQVALSSNNPKFLTATATTAIQAGGANGATDGLVAGDESVVYKNLDLTNWTYNSADGYWYYNTPLAPGAVTSNLLSSITLAGNTDMGKYTVANYYTTAATKPATGDIGSDPATQWVLYSGAVPNGTTYTRAVSTTDPLAPGYAGANYVLNITTEVLQGTQEAFTAEAATWGTTPSTVKSTWGVV